MPDLMPPHELRSERLLIRSWEPRDAPLYKAAVDESLKHLRPWIDWAHNEPTSVDTKTALLQRFRGRFDLGQDFQYGLFTPDGKEVAGSAGLHARSKERSFEVGYWIRASRSRQGLATEAVAALTKASFELCGVDRIEIHIAVGNDASCGVPRKLGYAEEATLRRRMPGLREGEEPRDEIVFTLFADAYPDTLAAALPLEAYDAAGRRLL